MKKYTALIYLLHGVITDGTLFINYLSFVFRDVDNALEDVLMLLKLVVLEQVCHQL